MGFMNSYRCTRHPEDRRNPRITILPFFNYVFDSDQDAAIDTDPRNVDMPRWKQKIVYANQRYHDSFTRGEVCVNPELEEQFSELLPSRYRNIWQTPYICLSASEYHRENSDTLLGRIITYAGFACAIPALCGAISRNPLMFWLSVLAALVLIIIGGIRDSKHQETPLKDMGEAYIEKNRQAYLNSMIKSYGPKLGGILQQIAIEEGRDRR